MYLYVKCVCDNVILCIVTIHNKTQASLNMFFKTNLEI